MFYIAYTIRDGKPSWVVSEEATGLVDKVFDYVDREAAENYLVSKLNVNKTDTVVNNPVTEVVPQKAKRGRRAKNAGQWTKNYPAAEISWERTRATIF